MKELEEVIKSQTPAKTLPTCRNTCDSHSFTQQKNSESETTSNPETDSEKKRKVALKEKKRLEAELALCEGCTGTCTKEQNRYTIPVVTDYFGEEHIARAFCKFGEQRQLQTKCRAAHIPAKYIGKTFGDYEITSENKRAFTLAKWFVAEKSAQGLYLYGNCGTGKTYLASLIAQEFVDEGTVIFGDVPDLLSRLKETFDTGGTEALINRYAKCKLLVLDDIGTGKVTEWNVGVLYQVINARYNANLPLIVTSNYDFDDLRNRLTVKDKNGGIIDDFTAKRIVSRLSEMCIQAFLGLQDRRK